MNKIVKTRKTYTEEFKREAIALAKQPDMGIEAAARDLGISSGSLHRWVRFEKEKGVLAFPGRGNEALSEEQAELKKLRRENEILRQEREILKKATVFFANQK